MHCYSVAGKYDIPRKLFFNLPVVFSCPVVWLLGPTQCIESLIPVFLRHVRCLSQETRKSAIAETEPIVRRWLLKPCIMRMMAIPDVGISEVRIVHSMVLIYSPHGIHICGSRGRAFNGIRTVILGGWKLLNRVPIYIGAFACPENFAIKDMDYPQRTALPYRQTDGQVDRGGVWKCKYGKSKYKCAKTESKYGKMKYDWVHGVENAQTIAGKVMHNNSPIILRSGKQLSPFFKLVKF